MTTEQHHIEVSGIPIEVIRKDIKHLHVGVYPPGGRVRVAAPLRLDDEDIRLAIVSRLGWIRRKQQGFETQDRQSKREMVTGESHYFQGQRYRLDVVEHDAPPAVDIPNNTTIELRVRPGADRDKRAEILNEWYRRRLKEHIPSLIAKWEPKVGVDVADWGVRRMKTRWGTCNTEARTILLNLELAKKSPACLEYILVHELVHLIERPHSERFLQLMDDLMPKWRLHRDELNRAPLAHEEWGY